MRRLPFLFVLLLPACGTESEIIIRCDVVSDAEVADDAAPFGFTAAEAVAAVDGRAWDVAWVSDHPESYAGSTVAALSMTVRRGSDPVHAVELAEGVAEGDGTCGRIGAWLSIPVDVTLTDPDGTFVASGTALLSATALSDDAMDFGWLPETLALSPVPADIAEAADTALADLGTTAGAFSLGFEGRFDALFVDVGVEGQDGSGNTPVARGQVTAAE
ncbi:MAG: hypothetical protein V4850_33005 [Myxococcota bacterium]